jgi:hypothetical protein
MKRLIILLAALTAVSGAWAEGDAEGKGILDFATPPNELYPARLVGIDGKNVDEGAMRSSYWVEPGTHSITVTALIDNSMQVGTIDIQQKTDPGTVTITVEADKRYMIAAQATDNKGNWQPVIWKEEAVK